MSLPLSIPGRSCPLRSKTARAGGHGAAAPVPVPVRGRKSGGDDAGPLFPATGGSPRRPLGRAEGGRASGAGSEADTILRIPVQDPRFPIPEERRP